MQKGFLDFVDELANHTESTFSLVNSTLNFKTQEIKIDRFKKKQEIHAAFDQSKMAIIIGKGGVGKTSLIKEIYFDYKLNTPFFVFKAVDFNVNNANEVFKNYGNFTLLDFNKGFEKEKIKYIVIDSAEQLANLGNQDAYREFLAEIIKYNWRVLLSIKSDCVDFFQANFLGTEVFQSVYLDELEKDQLFNLSREHAFSLPSQERLLEILKKPFYLSQYLACYQEFSGK